MRDEENQFRMLIMSTVIINRRIIDKIFSNVEKQPIFDLSFLLFRNYFRINVLLFKIYESLLRVISQISFLSRLLNV